jgi:hypothetical protein
MLRTLVPAAALWPSTGCFLTADTFHCTLTLDALEGDTPTCAEFSDFEGLVGQGLKASFGAFCQSLGVSKVTPGPCPDEDKVGGCQEEGQDGLYVQTTWQYTSEVTQSPADLTCTSDQTLLGPDGTPWTPTDTDGPADTDPSDTDPTDTDPTDTDPA